MPSPSEEGPGIAAPDFLTASSMTPSKGGTDRSAARCPQKASWGRFSTREQAYAQALDLSEPIPGSVPTGVGLGHQTTVGAPGVPKVAERPRGFVRLLGEPSELLLVDVLTLDVLREERFKVATSLEALPGDARAGGVDRVPEQLSKGLPGEPEGGVAPLSRAEPSSRLDPERGMMELRPGSSDFRAAARWREATG